MAGKITMISKVLSSNVQRVALYAILILSTSIVPTQLATAQSARTVTRTAVIHPYDRSAEVHQKRIVVRLPLPYMHETFPNPPISGYYAWKISFGGDAEATVVLRTDSAVRALSVNDVMKETSLYLCPPNATSVLACTQKAAGTARAKRDLIEVEVADLSVVTRVREKRPDSILRQTFEPGGQYRVDYIQIRYIIGI